ncbi:organic cation transporter-like protein isoform X2 [Cylas formicarius]|uniref:organic cation transporter-like protein isoform X2 n=1 Tax=Cylas formicarius TaxID=197179 RepID=UPI002958900C|nr:organic cation transporter-like protein isoform X2 [Cylas formicarius]
MDGTYDLDALMNHLGDFGNYQAWQFTLHILSAVTAGLNMLSLVTVAAVPDHRCQLPGENTTMIYRNDSVLSQYIPRVSDERFDSCLLLNSTTNSSFRCNSWTYDDLYYKSSRAIEWDFVCDRRWMGAVAQSMYMFGVFTGAVTLGNMADKYGRKPIFCWSAVLQLMLGVAVAFTPEYYSFLVVTYLYGIFGSAGSYIPGFVLTMELVGPSKRSVCGISFQAAFATGMMLVEIYERMNKPIPTTWALNENGDPEVDPKIAMESSRLQPLGGSEESGGYKGTALAMMIEILTGILSGSNYGPLIPRWGKDQATANLGHVFIAINPEAFAADFESRLGDYLGFIRSSEPKDLTRPVLVPGDPERIHMDMVDRQGGICYVDDQHLSNDKLAQLLNVKAMKSYVISGNQQ